MIWKKGELTGPSFQARRKRRSRGKVNKRLIKTPGNAHEHARYPTGTELTS
jgi:hypothetical protein